MNPAEQAHAFCSALFAGDTGDDGELAGQHATLFVLPSRAVHWLTIADPAAIAARAIDADAKGGSGVYVSMTTSTAVERGLDGNRARAEDVTAVYGVWADLDIAGQAHTAKNLPPDLAAVERILDAMVLKPSIFWSSGHGYQALWLFTAPVVIDTDAERAEMAALVRDWLRTMAVHAHRLGRWRVDMVHDLARVLRMPGSTNRKLDDVRPVEIIDIDPDRRYSPDQIAQHCLDREVLDQSALMAKPERGSATLVDLGPVWKTCTSTEYRERHYEPEWIADLMEALRGERSTSRAAETILKIWEYSAKGQFSDHSRADASMARHLANLDVDEVDAAEIITCLRLRTGHKIEKVQPTKRGQDYLVANTIGKTFASARIKKLERDDRLAANRAAEDIDLDRQDAAALRSAVPDAAVRAFEQDRTEQAQSDGGVTGVSAMVVADWSQRVEQTRPDPQPPAPTAAADETPADEPPADEPELPDPTLDDDPADELPADETPTDEIAADAPPADETSNDAPPPPPPPRDPPPTVGSPDPDEPRRARNAGAPALSAWGPRTEHASLTLKALTKDLISERNGDIQFWALQQRGRGADAKRRIMLRPGPRFAWPDHPPDGWRPGMPLFSGWWPVQTFDKVGGFVLVLEKDCNLITNALANDEFQTRYRQALIRLWQPDSSGGSITSVTRAALRQHLLDFAPTRQWSEAAAVGASYLVLQSAEWTPAAEFAVLLRWVDFGRYVRTHFGLNVTPQMLAEMAELTGAQIAETHEQDGRWRVLRRDYFDDRTWALILENARLAEVRREDRHGMHVVRGHSGHGGDHDDDAPLLDEPDEPDLPDDGTSGMWRGR